MTWQQCLKGRVEVNHHWVEHHNLTPIRMYCICMNTIATPCFALCKDEADMDGEWGKKLSAYDHVGLSLSNTVGILWAPKPRSSYIVQSGAAYPILPLTKLIFAAQA